MTVSPLREIIGTINIKVTQDSLFSITMEVYECGHYAPVKQDIIGEYYAIRRRCNKCKLNKPPQLNLSQIEKVKQGEILLKYNND